MKKYLSFVIGVAVIFIVLQYCKHKPDVIPKPVTPTDTTGQTGSPCSADTVYFTNTILPLIISNCATAGCHDAATMVEDLNLTSYEGIMQIVKRGNPGGSSLYRNMTGQGDKMMPPAGKLPQAQLDLIYKWILQGAKNNYCNGNTGPCDSINVSYANTLVPVINSYCKGCHNTANPSQGINLDNYQGVQTVALNGQLMGGLTGKLSPMPKYSLPLTKCNIAKFRQWIKEGAKNN